MNTYYAGNNSFYGTTTNTNTNTTVQGMDTNTARLHTLSNLDNYASTLFGSGSGGSSSFLNIHSKPPSLLPLGQYMYCTSVYSIVLLYISIDTKYLLQVYIIYHIC